MNKKNVALLSIVAVIFAALGIFLGNRHTSMASAENPAVGKFFAQTMNDTGGKPQALSQWQGKPLVINFWATWCAPCVQEMPELSALQGEIQSKQIQILGIGIDSSSNIAEFASKYKISYPLYTGGLEASELSRQLGNQAGGLPFTVVIGRDGQVKKTFLGRLKMDELRKEIATL
jgi:thiol-disulfide isomerase/thioredoxin